MPSRTERLGRWQPWLILGALLFAFGLRVYRLDAQSLWADEGNSAALAGRDLLTISQQSAADIHPPLYYFCLHLWTQLFGTSEVALRSLSVLLALVLLWGVFLLGVRLYGMMGGLLGALFVAVSPFQVYYAQEARMYMMLSCWGVLAAYATWRILQIDLRPNAFGSRWWRPALLYVCATSAGLYTHYFYPAILLTLNLVYLIGWRERRGWMGGWHLLWRWVGLQALALLIFVPWLGTAASRLHAWPAGGRHLDPMTWLGSAWKTLTLGPTGIDWPFAWLPFFAALIMGLWPWWRRRRHKERLVWSGYWLPVLGCVVPVLLMMILDLRSEARLKFLLLGSPFLALSLARGVAGPRMRARFSASGWSWLTGAWAVLACLGILLSSGASLWNYYFQPHTGRDDYRGMARYISAVARPGDAIILNAPGQWDVFSYYYDGDWPVYRLPEERPPNRVKLESTLRYLTIEHGRLYVLYWATDESDPGGIMEGWLDSYAFKGVDVWNGNVRFVIYETAAAFEREVMQPSEAHFSFGDTLELTEYAQPAMSLAAGDLLPISLTWHTVRTPEQPLKMFLQILDAGNHIVGQRDAELGRGLRPTTEWQAGQVVVENHAVFIQPGTPPGEYRLILGIYDSVTGIRLPVLQTDQDYVELGMVSLQRPEHPIPRIALTPAYSLDHVVGPLRLFGRDGRELGKPAASQEPISPDSVLHLTTYWQALADPLGEWRQRIFLSEQVLLDWAPIGGGYVTTDWIAGEIVRDQMHLFLPADIRAGNQHLWVEVKAPGDPIEQPARARFSLGTVAVR